MRARARQTRQMRTTKVRLGVLQPSSCPSGATPRHNLLLDAHLRLVMDAVRRELHVVRATVRGEHL